MRVLTERQAEGLRAVKRLIEKQGYPPTLREISDALKVTNTAARDHLLALRRAGKVDWVANKSRTLRIL